MEESNTGPKGQQWGGVVFLVILLAGGGFVAKSSFDRVQRQARVAATCEAVIDQRFEEAVAISEGLSGPDVEGQMAAGCRCNALVTLFRGVECFDLIEEIIGVGEVVEWVPPGEILRATIRYTMDRGNLQTAGRLVAFGRAAYPADPMLIEHEFEIRMATEDEKTVLAHYEELIEQAADPVVLQILVASHYTRTNDYAAARRALGEQWPPVDHTLFEAWVHKRTRAESYAGDLEAMQRSFARWRELAGESVEIDGHYALRLSTANLFDPEHPWIELLQAVVDREAEVESDEMMQWIYKRLIGHQLADGKAEQALASFDRGSARVEIPGLSRGQLERALTFGAGVEIQGAAFAGDLGTLQFRFDAVEPGDELLLSNNAELEPDADAERLSIPRSGILEADRSLAAWPERWVLRDAQGAARASGRVWPVEREVLNVAVRRGPPVAPSLYTPVERAPGDGRRRVFTIVLDCADWRLTQYLRARGELPFTDFLMREGASAVLESDPPFTAAAMEKLVSPQRGAQPSFFGLVHRMGLEIAGLESVGVNPFAFLSPLLPAGANLFETLGSKDKVVANMLFSHGSIDAGHHAEVIGPGGLRSALDTGSTVRPLRPEEIEMIPEVRVTSRVRELSEAIAGELDTSVHLVEAGEIDALLLRVESLDILTHRLFGEILETAQDDGAGTLLDVYRYIDGRLAELYASLDEDDVLIVMSDHGIRTAMEHEADAIFVAIGHGVAPGRVAGRPRLEGVPLALGNLLGIESPWPDTGLRISLEQVEVVHEPVSVSVPVEGGSGAPNGI